VFLIFFNPFEDFAVAESACDLLFQRDGVHSREF
jgi:hypothetical protein